MNNAKILTHLLNNKTEEFTINQIAKATGLNYRIAHTQVKLLEEDNLIQTKRIGNSLLCSLTHKFDEKIFRAEFERQNQLPKKILRIKDRFEKANQSYILLLFGSYAKRTNTKGSDIDLLAITENKEEIEEITDLIPENIHLTGITYAEFIKMNMSKELSVVSEAVKHNIVLLGIEEYYRLLQNAL